MTHGSLHLVSTVFAGLILITRTSIPPTSFVRRATLWLTSTENSLGNARVSNFARGRENPIDSGGGTQFSMIAVPPFFAGLAERHFLRQQ